MNTTTTITSHALMLLLMLTLSMAGCGTATAQQFSVADFRQLPNDVSAFITPVRDLNGEACALLKVVAPSEFAFSTPLGIVKRTDKVGEIWLYVPRGSRQITIKHPQWGVMRDYRFTKPLESHVAYEMRLACPQQAQTVKTDTVILTKTIVDTVAIEKPKVRTPLSISIMATATMHRNGPSWGIMVAIMRRHGLYMHARSDLRAIGGTVATSDKDGYVGGSDIMPYYTGRTRHSTYAFTAGAIHRVWRMLSVFEGVGYGRTATAWQLAESEGGGYALNDGLTHAGMAAEAGLMATVRRISIMLSALTIKGKQWCGSIGIGIRLGKK